MKTTFNSVSELVATMNPEVIAAYIDLIEKESAAKDAEIKGLKAELKAEQDRSYYNAYVLAKDEVTALKDQTQLLLAQVARMSEAMKQGVEFAKYGSPDFTSVVSVMESALTSLPAEAQQLLEDKARLDWLTNHHEEFAQELQRIGWASPNDAQWEKLKFFLRRMRFAIDSAMKGTK